MRSAARPDDFATRSEHLKRMSDEELHAHFWSLAERIVAPLIEEARTHTSPSIERSVLLRMGFSSSESKRLVAFFAERELLGQGAGRLVLELARSEGIAVREAGTGLLAGRFHELLPK